jgi:hypothetical protein
LDFYPATQASRVISSRQHDGFYRSISTEGHCRRKAIHFGGSSNVFPVPLMREDSLAPNYGAGRSECNTEV